MKVGSFCTGYGGLDLAVEQYYNAELSWVSEIDNNCNKLLEKRFNKPNLGDLTSVNWEDVEPVDIICAGFPCQPFSDAGSKKGDKDERAIFPLVAESIGVLRPRYVFLENVAGITTTRNGGGLDVVGLLTQMGYDCRWGIIRASDIGACHQRARWFCVASDPNSDREGGGQTGTVREQGNNERQINKVRPDRSSSLPENSNDRGSSERQTGTVQGTSGGQDQFQGERRQDGGDTVRPSGSSEILRDTNQLHDDLPESGGSTSTDSDNERCEERNSATIPIQETVAETAGSGDSATNSDSRGLQELRTEHGLGETSEQPPVEPSGNDDDSSEWGQFEEGIRRWEFVTGRTAPRPTDERGLNPSFVEWMMGVPENHVCNQGLSRTAELKMLGNGIVPQQCALALCVLLGDEQ